MTVQYPGHLWLLLLLVPLLITYFFGYRRGRRSLRILGGVWREKQLANIYLVKRFFMGLFSLLFVASLVLAAAGVTWGRRPVKETRSGLDTALVVDLSRSMLAQDVNPSRLDRAVLLMESLLQGLPGSRFALVGFKGEAETLVPLSEDTEAISRFTDYLGPATLSVPGTDLEAALEEAARALEPGDGRFKAVVLISDGEGLTGSPGKMARRMRQEGILFYSLGVGTGEGGRIPRGEGQWVRNERGNPVVSQLNPGLLQELAGGRGSSRYYSAGSPAAAGSLRARIDEDTGGARGEGLRYEKRTRFRFFLGLALLFFVLNLLVRGVRWKGIF